MESESKSNRISPQLYHSAAAFYKSAINWYDNWEELGYGHFAMEMSACIVNLSFSLELILKGLGMFTDHLTKGHNLLDLYHSLPNQLQQEINTRFQKRLKSNPPDDKSFLTAITTEVPGTFTKEQFEAIDSKSQQLKSKFRNKKPDLAIVLEHHQMTFVEWRYNWERNEHLNWETYDFGIMKILTESASLLLHDMIHQKYLYRT